MGKNKVILCGLLLGVISAASVSAQSVRSLVHDGNSLYEEKKYTDAEVNYRKALEREQGLLQGQFNLGNALHKQGKFEDAVKAYESSALKAEEKETKAAAYYNIGNSLVKEQKYEDAAKAYVESLKLRPDDMDTKYNLSYALNMLKKQQQQQQQSKDKKDKNQDQNQNQKQDDKQKQDNNDQKQQQKDQQQKDRQKDQQRNQSAQQQEKKISKADAERILEVLKNNEREIQKKLRVRQAVRPRGEKDW